MSTKNQPPAVNPVGPIYIEKRYYEIIKIETSIYMPVNNDFLTYAALRCTQLIESGT
jgi:hypothetical protein